MDKNCPSVNRIERFFRGDFESEVKRMQWESHVEICDDCRDALRGHHALAGSLATLPIPHLSPEFEQELEAALSRDRAPAVSRDWKRLLLWAYWLMTLGASLLILDSIQGTIQIPTAFWITLLVSATLPLIALGFALKQLRLGFFDLLHFVTIDPEFQAGSGDSALRGSFK